MKSNVITISFIITRHTSPNIISDSTSLSREGTRTLRYFAGTFSLFIESILKSSIGSSFDDVLFLLLFLIFYKFWLKA